MKSSKLKRRANALARFRVLPFTEWVKARHLIHNEKPIGIVPDVDLMAEHEKYCERKAVERSSLMRGV